ncbi:MAG: hypothetical protein WHT84_01190 [Breznakiellaceae bacterium]
MMKRTHNVGGLFLFLVWVLGSCSGESSKTTVVPSENPPLSRAYIGYGQVIVPYAQVLDKPGKEGIILRIIRENELYPILERRYKTENGRPDVWVRIGTEESGWVRASQLSIYATEKKARFMIEKKAHE